MQTVLTLFPVYCSMFSFLSPISCRLTKWPISFDQLCIADFRRVRQVGIVVEPVCNGGGWNSINRQCRVAVTRRAVGKEKAADDVRLELRIGTDDACSL